MFSIRNAQPFDLDFLLHLEKLCFQDNRRFSRSSLRNSILSLSQEVYVVEYENNKIGASIVQFYKKTLRIYSIAVDPNYQGKSVGKMMLEHILNTARSKGYSRVSLEVLNTATKAASYMGDGLYGVDLKEVDGKVYLIEVNDNPNVDFGVEDKILGDDLYIKIMESIFNRIENSRNIKRFISN